MTYLRPGPPLRSALVGGVARLERYTGTGPIAMRRWIVGVLLLLGRQVALAQTPMRPVSLEERIAARGAIESVYDARRIWPQQNAVITWPSQSPILLTVARALHVIGGLTRAWRPSYAPPSRAAPSQTRSALVSLPEADSPTSRAVASMRYDA